MVETLLDQQLEPLRGPLAMGDAGGAERQRLDRDQRGGRGLVHRQSHEGVEARDQALAEVVGLAVGLADPGADLVDDLVEGGEEALLLVFEMVVEGALGDAGQGDQFTQGRARVAIPRDRLDHRSLQPRLLVPGHLRRRHPAGAARQFREKRFRRMVVSVGGFHGAKIACQACTGLDFRHLF